MAVDRVDKLPRLGAGGTEALDVMKARDAALLFTMVLAVGSGGLLLLAAHRGALGTLHHPHQHLCSNVGQRPPLRTEPIAIAASAGGSTDTAALGMEEPNEKGLPGSADCGGSGVELVVGVLASPTPRSTTARRVIRETWMRFPVEPSGAVVVRFLLALNESGHVPTEMLIEAKQHGDMVFLDTHDAYRNLVRKVTLFFGWVAAQCPRSARVFKTDDDSFVRIDRLLILSRTLPITRFYYGSFLKKMPARWRDKVTQKLTHEPLEGNIQNHAEWPWYVCVRVLFRIGNYIHRSA